MRLYLAPLFLTSRACKHCVRNFYRDNPGGWMWHHELRCMPPLGWWGPPGRFAPDLPVFVMFDTFVMDGEAYERMADAHASDWLGEWPKLVRALEAEGCLETVDSEAISRSRPHKRGWMLRRDMRNVEEWAGAMAYFDSVFAAADEELRSPVDSNGHHFTWEPDPDKGSFLEGPDGLLHIPAGGLGADEDHDPIHGALAQFAQAQLRGHLRNLNALLAVSDTLGARLMAWAPYGEYLRTKSARAANHKVDPAQAAKTFFSVAFPRYAPRQVEDIARLRSDRRLVSLRAAITQAADSGDVLDRDYPQRVLEEVLGTERRAGRLRRLTAYLTAPIGLIPYAGSLLQLAAQEVVDAVARRRAARAHPWFYLISDGRGHS